MFKCLYLQDGFDFSLTIGRFFIHLIRGLIWVLSALCLFYLVLCEVPLMVVKKDYALRLNEKSRVRVADGPRIKRNPFRPCSL